MRIRAANEADLVQITAIYGHHVREGLASFEETAPTLDDMRARYLALVQGGYPYLVAVDEPSPVAGEGPSGILGYAYAGPYRTRPAYRFSVENSVYVDPDAHRQGAGSALLAELIVQCEAGAWRQMVAIIGDSANAPSIRLHERLGFSHAGVLTAVGYKHERWVDSVLMQRALGRGDTVHPHADLTQA